MNRSLFLVFIYMILLVSINGLSEEMIVTVQPEKTVYEQQTMLSEESSPMPSYLPNDPAKLFNSQSTETPMVEDEPRSSVTDHSFANTEDYYAKESLYWTKNGAFGSWAGSIFAAIALIISLFAFYQPRKVKLNAKVTSGIIGFDCDYSALTLTIEVKNIGFKPVTVTNVYFTIQRNDIFIGMIAKGTLLEGLEPKFPVRLEQGEQFSFYVPHDKFSHFLNEKAKYYPLDAQIGIRVDEVLTGIKRFKTNLKIRDFLRINKE